MSEYLHLKIIGKNTNDTTIYSPKIKLALGLNPGQIGLAVDRAFNRQ